MVIDPFARRRIIGLTEAALRTAGVVDVLPTPLEQVSAVVGINEIIGITDLPEDLVITKPSALRRILGAYLYRSDIAFVDLSQPIGRQRFILAHETGHKIVPWHSDSYHLDDEARLFRDCEEQLEDEANLAGTLVMFQGARFHHRALDYETTIRTPIALADTYGASLHASIWFYVEHHPDPVALIIAGQFVRANGTVPIWRSVQSSSFTTQFGTLERMLPPGGLPARTDSPHPFGALTAVALKSIDVSSDEISLPDLGDAQVACKVDTFFNQRCLFLLVTTKRRVRRGRRIVLSTLPHASGS